MSQNDTLYFLFGVGSEYVLKPLADRLQQDSKKVIELDLNRVSDPWAVIGKIVSPVIFITSAHLSMTGDQFTNTYGETRTILSPLSLLQTLQPIRSFYISHDVGEAILDEELPWLSLFDAFFPPRKGMSYLNQYTSVHECGWIRKHVKTEKFDAIKASEIRIGMAFSELGYHRRLGIDRTIKHWLPIISCNPTMKFPAWPGVEKLENAFRNAGLEVVPSDTDMANFISNHHLIITNGLSSVTHEAALSGRKVLNVVDGSHPKFEHQQSFAGLKNVQYGDIDYVAEQIVNIRKSDKIFTCSEDTLPPFDMDSALHIINGNSI